MSSNIHSLLDKAVDILGNFRSASYVIYVCTIFLKQSDNLLASEELNAGHCLFIPDGDTNLRR